MSGTGKMRVVAHPATGEVRQAEHRGWVGVAPDALGRMLHLPEGTRVVKMVVWKGELSVLLEGPIMPAIHQGAPAPLTVLLYRRKAVAEGKPTWFGKLWSKWVGPLAVEDPVVFGGGGRVSGGAGERRGGGSPEGAADESRADVPRDTQSDRRPEKGVRV
jgi:hypothetical protein